MLKVVLCGSCGVGKTNTARRIKGETFVDVYQKTHGVDYLASDVTLSDKRGVKLTIWDTTGNSDHTAFTRVFYQGADVIILMFDITNKESFSDLSSIWMKVVKESVYPRVLPSDKSLLLVGNKLDLEVERKVVNSDAKTFADEIGAEFVETSAKTGLNMDVLLKCCSILQVSERNAMSS